MLKNTPGGGRRTLRQIKGNLFGDRCRKHIQLDQINPFFWRPTTVRVVLAKLSFAAFVRHPRRQSMPWCQASCPRKGQSTFLKKPGEDTNGFWHEFISAFIFSQNHGKKVYGFGSGSISVIVLVPALHPLKLYVRVSFFEPWIWQDFWPVESLGFLGRVQSDDMWIDQGAPLPQFRCPSHRHHGKKTQSQKQHRTAL